MIRPALSVTLLVLAGCSPVVVDFKDDVEIPGETDIPDESGAPDIVVDRLVLDFGVVLVGGLGAAEIVVQNEGDRTLESLVQASGPAVFQHTPGEFALAAGLMQVVDVTCQGSELGAYEGVIAFDSNDPDEPVVEVVVTCEIGADADGDGFAGSDDCDDADATVNPDAEETWYDGVDQDCSGSSDFDQDGDGDDATGYGGTDCDDLDPTVSGDAEEVWYDGIDQDCAGGDDFDQDGDGHTPIEYGGDDCDDTAPTAYPGHIEIEGNGIDDDCDGTVDEPLSTVDTDGDGYTEVDGDCLEGDPTVHPGAEEVWYDGVDQDCAGGSDYDQDGDGVLADGYGGDDCDDTDAAVNPDAAETWYDGVDQDCSGGSDYDQDLDGHDVPGGGGLDCDDLDPSVNPDAVDTWYDGLDQDCDGASDYDADRDGYDDIAWGGTDCDDLAPGTNPGASEIWYDGVDQDCAGDGDFDQDGDGHDALVGGGDDCDDTSAAVNPDATEVWYDGVDADCTGGSDFDADGDGHDAADYGGDDCDESDAAVNPSAVETWYDGVDQDCDGGSDFDQDRDGEDATTYAGTDCDDLDATVSAGATEVWYDGVDQDCDGADDYDQDGDGVASDDWGGADCDDTDAATHPGAAEVCDGGDDDCDGSVDEGVTTTFYVDADADGYGSTSATVAACSAPAGYVATSTDCDDAAASVHPGAAEVCDDIDQDCDGAADDGLSTATYYADADGDGYGDAVTAVTDCARPSGYVTSSTDCDDTDPTANPGATELAYDATDNDCDGAQDEMSAESVSNWTILGEGSSDQIGSGGVYTAQDLDGDGHPELVIGGPQVDAEPILLSYGNMGLLAFHDLARAGLGVDVTAGYFTLYGDSADDYFGASFAVIGDVDGGGATEVVVGAYQDDVDNTDDGTVYTLDVGGETGWDYGPWIASGELRGDVSNSWTGYAVAVGDFDGNGVAELATGAPGEQGGKGQVYVSFLDDDFGTDSIDNDESQFWVAGVSANDHLGYAVAFGDLDHDGYDDLVACSPDDDDGGSGSGTCWVVPGNSSRDTSTSVRGAAIRDHDTAVITGGAASDQLGKTPRSLSVGDIDGDGKDDLAIGMPGYDGYTTDGGAVLVFRNGTLSGSETAATATWLVRGDGALGTAVSLGDVTGDGVHDLLAGATTAGSSAQGVVYLLEGGLAAGTFTFPADQYASWTGARAGDLFGTAISGARDLDGDGVTDFAVAATGNDDGATDAGKVYVLSGY